MSVWDRLIGQAGAVEQLRAAAAAGRRALAGDERAKVAHSWLFTGPPGSGRSVAARCLAAALQCTGAEPGCGECSGCRSVLAGSHPDVNELTTEAMTYKVEEVRGWLEVAYSRPSLGRWRVLIVEDADRMTPQTSNVILKSLEEPPGQTLWLLCAPSPDDLLITVRSRCRQLRLTTPPVDSLTKLLMQEAGVSQDQAHLAAQISQSHVGYARALARDPQLRQAQVEALMTALRPQSVGEAVVAAQQLLDLAKKNSVNRLEERNAEELATFKQNLGLQPGERVPRPVQAQIRQLEEDQKRRAKRSLADELDRILVDLLGFFRDVTVVQLGSPVPPINPDLMDQVSWWAERVDARGVVDRTEAINLARERLQTNVATTLMLEALLISLVRPDLAN